MSATLTRHVYVEIDAVGRDAVEALALLLHQVEELVAQHARRLGRREDLVRALLLRRLDLPSAALVAVRLGRCGGGGRGGGGLLLDALRVGRVAARLVARLPLVPQPQQRLLELGAALKVVVEGGLLVLGRVLLLVGRAVGLIIVVVHRVVVVVVQRLCHRFRAERLVL